MVKDQDRLVIIEEDKRALEPGEVPAARLRIGGLLQSEDGGRITAAIWLRSHCRGVAAQKR